MKFRLRRTSYRQFEKCQYGLSVALRTQAKPTQTLALFRDVLRQVAPSMPIKTIRTMDQQIAESLSTERLTAYLSVFFAALAVLLVAVGCTGFWLIRLLGVPARSAFAGVGASSKLIASLLYPVKPSDPHSWWRQLRRSR